MTREELWLAAIAGLDGAVPPDYPVWHYEQMLAAIYDAVTGAADPRPFPERSWHLDEVLYAVYCAVAGVSPAPVCPEPTCRLEQFWVGILGQVNGDATVTVPEPVWRIEEFLKGVFDAASDWGATLLTETGNAPITLTNAIARAIKSLTQTGLCTQADTPTPTSPVDIVCNNGRVVAGNCISSIPDGQGTFITPSELTTNRIYKAFPTDLVVGRSYTVTVTGTSWLVIVQQKKPDGTDSSNVSGWVTTYDFTPEEGYIYGVAMRRSQDNITPADFNGTLTLDTTDGKPWTDGTPEVLSVGGKNLNAGTLDSAGYTSTGAESTSSTFVGTLCKIPCAEGEKYTVSFGGFTTSGISGVFINTWKTDGTFNSRQAIASGGETTYTIPTGVGMVNFTLYKTGGATIDDGAWMQVELGASATPYEPYIAPQTASVQNLLSVGNYADTQEIVSGAVNRKVGVAVLTGEENVGVSNACFTIPISDRITSKAVLLCSHFPYSNKTSSQTEDQTVISFSSTNIGFRYDACADKVAFAAWLAAQYAAGTPVIVVYPLAEETTESVAGQSLNTAAGTNVVSVTAEVSPVALSCEYYGASS